MYTVAEQRIQSHETNAARSKVCLFVYICICFFLMGTEMHARLIML